MPLFSNANILLIRSMQQVLDAVYENGVFRPLQPPEIKEGQQVQLVAKTNVELTPDQMLDLAAQVYQGLSEQEIDEIEQIVIARSIA